MKSDRNFNMCPAGEISAYIDGELDTARASEMDLHFADCDDCRTELNEQKFFLRHLDASLGVEREIDLPPDFAKSIVAHAESTVSGLRRPHELFNASFIGAGLLLFALFAMGAEAGKVFGGITVILEQAAAVGSFLGRLVYSVFVGVAIIIRTLGGQFRSDVAAILAAAIIIALFSIYFTRRFPGARRA